MIKKYCDLCKKEYEGGERPGFGSPFGEKDLCDICFNELDNAVKNSIKETKEKLRVRFE